jgi:hypothetical protein
MAVFALISILAENCFHLILIHQLDFPYIFTFEFEFMVLSNDLEFVRKLVGAYFINVIQVYDIFLFANMEIPNTVQLPSETMNRLICHYDW